MNKLKHLKRSLFYVAQFHFRIAVFLFLFFWSSMSYSQDTSAFFYTGSVQTFTVPNCVYTIRVKTWGAGGSGGGADSYGGAVGGAGAFVESDFAVTPGQILTVIVGGGAGPGANGASGYGGGSPGWGNGLIGGAYGGNAGGSGSSGGGGGGGGGSALYDGPSLLMVAGGGGGGSGGGQFSSGATGGGGGQNGNSSPGSCSSPGIAGASPNGNGTSGANKGGGDGGGGGAGGGGYNGGTGGGVASGCDCGACGGAGGTSWSSGTNVTTTNGNGQTPGNSTDINLPAGAAIGGGTSTKGGDGFVQIIFAAPPVARFRNTTVCNGNATQFTDSSTTSSGTITLRAWDFGDGSPLSSALNPSHTYVNGGLYNVSLTVNNTVGCIDTIIKPVQVYFNPVAGFTQSDVCFGDTMHFTNTSSIDNSTSIATYLWVFGDGGSSSSLQSPPHYYSSAGNFAVTLVTTSADACSNAISTSVNTFDAPKSSFAFSNTCLFDSAKFTNSSLNPVMGSIANWSWDFGDGSPLNNTTWGPHHLYSAPGNYQITLITHSSNLGCPDTFQNTITVFPMPVANFSFTDVCLNQAMNFYDSSTVSSGNIASRSWNFGDGTPISALQNPVHTYANAGAYNVTLTVTTDNSCKDTMPKNVVVHPLPFSHFSAANVCLGSTSSFNDFSTIPVNPTNDIIQSWVWNFADSSPFGTTQNSSHLYTAAGTYAVQLAIVSNFGCPDSITKTYIVNPNPAVLFSTNDTLGCEPLCSNFLNSSSIATGNNASNLWNLGDGSPAINSQSPYHCYINDSLFSPNIFNVTLTVTSDSGCVSTLSKNNYITVYPNPKAVFTVEPKTTTIIDPVISTKDLSTGGNNWNWNFGDLQTSAIYNPLPHTYGDTGTYLITLIVSTQYSCADTANETIVIEPEFVFYIPNTFSPDGDGINDSFIGKGVFIKDFKMTIFDRWGNLIFISNDKNKPWDGRANHGSDIAQRDTYIYVMEVTDIKNKMHSYKGIVTLMK